jgi:hypothetical protein
VSADDLGPNDGVGGNAGAGAGVDSADSSDIVRSLIARRAESRSLDYKRAMSFDRDSRGEIVKCLMAMANTREGGYLLIGVDQASGEVEPLSPEQAGSFDPTPVGDFARNHCSELPDFSSAVVHFDGDGVSQTVVLIRVRPFAREPIVCTMDLHGPNNRLVLRAGAVYVRTDDAKCVEIRSAQEMRELIRTAVDRHEGDLLERIRGLVGVPASGSGALDERLIAQKEAAEEFFDEAGLEPGWWQVSVIPPAWHDRMLSNDELRRLRGQSVVSLRGWDFPHVDHGGETTFDDGVQSVTKSWRYREAHRMHRSGLFVWRRRFSEDVMGETYKGHPTLPFVSSIFSVTEYFVFASRWIAGAASTASQAERGTNPGTGADNAVAGGWTVRVTVAGLTGRVLVDEPGLNVETRPIGGNRLDERFTFTPEQWEDAWRQVARDCALALFERFDFPVPAEVVDRWQEEILKGRYA